MLDRLAPAGAERTASELGADFGLSQPTVSQHLRVLREAGLVSVREEGRCRIYQLRREPLERVYEWTRKVISFSDPAGQVWRVRSQSSIKGGKPNNRALSPNLIVRDAAKAVVFYEQVLGAEQRYVSRLPNGKVLHAQLRIGESVFLVSEETMGMPEAQFAKFEQGMRTRSPHTLGGTSCVIELYVDDVDSTFEKALDAGAKVKMPPSDQFYGDRVGHFEDPFGHVWGVGQVLEELDAAEVDRRAAKRFAQA